MFAYALLHGVAASAITASLNDGPEPVGDKRYWRLLIEATIQDSTPPLDPFYYVGLTYVGMAETMGGVDVIDPALWNVRGSSSPSSSGEEGVNVFRGEADMNRGVVRGVGGVLHWYQWDFGSGSAKSIEELFMRPRPGYDNQHPTLFKLQYSDDALTWGTLFTVDRRDDPTNVYYSTRAFKYVSGVKPADPGKLNAHRYWRVRCKTFFDSNYICVSKAKFYHDKAHLAPVSTTGAEFLAAQWQEGSPANAWGTGQIVAGNSDFPWVLEIKYPSAVKVGCFSMFSRSAFGQAPNAMAIDYSDDGQNWFEAWEIPNQDAWGLDEQRFFVNPDALDPVGDVYWRIYGTQRQRGTAQWADMEWLSYSGTPDILIGGYPSAYGSYNSSYSHEYLVDDNPATSWATTSDGSPYPWWGYTFTDEPDDVQFVRFRGNSFSGSESWTRASIEKSDNGVTWTLVGDVTIPAVANGVWSAELPVVPVPALVPPTAPHRYWRFSIREGGSNYQSVYEAELLDELGTDLTSLGGTASANAAQGAYPASLAFDNNPATRWFDNGADGRWIQWDFGAGNAQLPVAWSLRCAANAPGGWDLMYSDNGTTWTVADRRIRLTWADDRKVFDIPGM